MLFPTYRGDLNWQHLVVWSRIYRGDWMKGAMHGCGVKLWKEINGSVQALEGKWFGDQYVGPIMPCGPSDATEAAVEADVAAYHARSFLVRMWSASWRTERCRLMLDRCCATWVLRA